MCRNPLDILQQIHDTLLSTAKKGIIIHSNVLRALESGMESAYNVRFIGQHPQLSACKAAMPRLPNNITK